MRRYSDADAAAEAERTLRDATTPTPTPSKPQPQPYNRADAIVALEYAQRVIETLLPVKSTPGQRRMAADAKRAITQARLWLDSAESAPQLQPPVDLVAHLFDVHVGSNGHVVATTRGIGPIVIAASSRAELQRLLPDVLSRSRVSPPG